MKTVKRSKIMPLKSVQPMMLAKNGEHIIITGRNIRSIHRLRNKKLAELQRKVSQFIKGITVRNGMCCENTKIKLQNALHKTTK